MTVRRDDRLADGPGMRPVRCDRCGAGVEARKASWQQTSVQWTAAAAAACAERRAAPGGQDGGLFLGCEALRASITRAALDGALVVPDP
ncbi:hypothetical protein GCM10009530_36410 [Microbispora corallina]|uniref:Ferredoxin n=1 Tax=Microbispora corallina TaxID=83302 RepID=A0ABQ4FYD4_9ACTN|nr:ferredoxin [Microbispora corallina]GIH39822.1 hypothetical protein Mco01_28220 [Microbispora corallina]